MQKKKNIDAGDNLIVIICHTSVIVLVSSYRDYGCLSPGDDTPRSTVADLEGTRPYITQIHVQHYPRNSSLKRNQWQFFFLFRFCFYTNNRRNWNLNVLLACDIDLHNMTDSSVMSQLHCLNLLVPIATTPLQYMYSLTHTIMLRP